VKIYTQRGDDGTTGLFQGGRVAKDHTGPEAYGAVDEAVSALGIARAAATEPLAPQILDVQRDLFVVGAELASSKRESLEPGVSLATTEMVDRLEEAIDEIVNDAGIPSEFIVPGGSPVAAALDLARTVVRRAERRAVTHFRVQGISGSEAVRYLNRLADYLFVLARASETVWTPSRRKEQ
jgi:cob(I)alamin adenosyltransferase